MKKLLVFALLLMTSGLYAKEAWLESIQFKNSIPGTRYIKIDLLNKNNNRDYDCDKPDYCSSKTIQTYMGNANLNNFVVPWKDDNNGFMSIELFQNEPDSKPRSMGKLFLQKGYYDSSTEQVYTYWTVDSTETQIPKVNQAAYGVQLFDMSGNEKFDVIVEDTRILLEQRAGESGGCPWYRIDCHLKNAYEKTKNWVTAIAGETAKAFETAARETDKALTTAANATFNVVIKPVGEGIAQGGVTVFEQVIKPAGEGIAKAATTFANKTKATGELIALGTQLAGLETALASIKAGAPAAQWTVGAGGSVAGAGMDVGIYGSQAVAGMAKALAAAAGKGINITGITFTSTMKDMAVTGNPPKVTIKGVFFGKNFEMKNMQFDFENPAESAKEIVLQLVQLFKP